MKLVRASLIALALSAITIGVGYTEFGASVAGNEPQAAAACARCGDGQCQRSCGENEKSCPRDCGGVPQETR
jgi:hypothetical protein